MLGIEFPLLTGKSILHHLFPIKCLTQLHKYKKNKKGSKKHYIFTEVTAQAATYLPETTEDIMISKHGRDSLCNVATIQEGSAANLESTTRQLIGRAIFVRLDACRKVVK